MATLVIVTILIRLAWPTIGSGTTPQQLLALASTSASLLRDARTTANRTGRPVAARFEAGPRRLAAGTDAVIFPTDVEIRFVAGGNCPSRDGAAEVVFRPDGSSCGGILSLRRGARTLRARVDWADGHIDITQGG